MKLLARGYQPGDRLEPWISPTLRFGAGLLCGGETSVFLPILSEFQWFLAKNWQYLLFLTRKTRSDFFRSYFTQGFGFQRTASNSFRGRANKSRASKIIAKIFDVFLPYKPTFLHFVAAVSLWKSWGKKGGVQRHTLQYCVWRWTDGSCDRAILLGKNAATRSKI